MKKQYKQIIVGGAIACTAFCAGLILGYYYRHNQNSLKITTVTNKNTTEENNKKYFTKENDKKDTSINNINTKQIKGNMEFKKDNTTKQPSFNSPWKSSPDNSKSICIEGKGPDVAEEGIGTIYLKEASGKLQTIKYDNTKFSPVYVDWVDNTKIFVITGNSYGSLVQNNNLYILNIDTMNNKSIYSSKNNESIQEAFLVNKKVNLKLKIYDDTNFNKFHGEEKTIDANDI